MTARQEATTTETIATTVVFRKASVTLVLDQSVTYGLKLKVSQRILALSNLHQRKQHADEDRRIKQGEDDDGERSRQPFGKRSVRCRELSYALPADGEAGQNDPGQRSDQQNSCHGGAEGPVVCKTEL